MAFEHRHQSPRGLAINNLLGLVDEHQRTARTWRTACVVLAFIAAPAAVLAIPTLFKLLTQ